MVCSDPCPQLEVRMIRVMRMTAMMMLVAAVAKRGYAQTGAMTPEQMKAMSAHMKTMGEHMQMMADRMKDGQMTPDQMKMMNDHMTMMNDHMKGKMKGKM